MSQMGQQRRFERVSATSAIPPIATELLRRGERRKGPGRDIEDIASRHYDGALDAYTAAFLPPTMPEMAL